MEVICIRGEKYIENGKIKAQWLLTVNAFIN